MSVVDNKYIVVLHLTENQHRVLNEITRQQNKKSPAELIEDLIGRSIQSELDIASLLEFESEGLNV